MIRNGKPIFFFFFFRFFMFGIELDFKKKKKKTIIKTSILEITQAHRLSPLLEIAQQHQSDSTKLFSDEDMMGRIHFILGSMRSLSRRTKERNLKRPYTHILHHRTINYLTFFERSP